MGQVVLSLPSDGTTIDASDVNTPLNTLVNEFNGNIDDNNIKTGANISGAKLNDASIPGKKFDSTTYGGWVAGVLPAVSSVTCNGNRSYDVTFASTVASYLTPGMRIRTTRTAAAPTGAISLNGSTQYANKTSPAGMTFTDDFVVSAWVKMTSYGDYSIASCYNGTSGWDFGIDSTGRVALTGFNGGAGNYSFLKSYQSIPLNKWVHIAAQLDMSTFTATTTTSYAMIDGLDVPVSVTRAGTNPTALVQAGNLEIGSRNGGSQFFPGNIAQVAIYNAKVTQANIRATISQSLTGAETSLISAYKLDQASGLTDLNTGNANNLTAQGSPTYSTASPFTTDANGTPGGSYDYAIVQKVSTTTATVQVPEGCTIPTSGGVSAVDLSAWKAPFGMPVQRGKWQLVSLVRTQYTQSSAANGTWYNLGSQQLTIPVGEWVAGYDSPSFMNATSAAVICATLSTGASTANDTEFITETYIGTTITGGGSKTKRRPLSVTAAAPYYLNVSPLFGTGTITIYNLDNSTFIPVALIEAENAYL